MNSSYTSRSFLTLLWWPAGSLTLVSLLLLSPTNFSSPLFYLTTMTLLFSRLSASFYKVRGHHNGYLVEHHPGAFPGSTTLRHAYAVQVGDACGQGWPRAVHWHT